MIHSTYDHGGDQPATGLSIPQLTGASRDAAGTLWIDLVAAEPDERTRILVDVLSAEPSGFAAAPDGGQGLVLGARHARLTARVPGGVVSAGNLATLVLYLGPNYVVTDHPGLEFVADLRVSARAAMPAGGAAGLAGAILEAVSDACSGRLGQLEAELSKLEGAVSASPGQGTGRRLYAVRRELETLSASLPALAGACRALATAKLPALAAVAPTLERPADMLERQARVARRLRRRGDVAMAAHSAELLASLGRWVRSGVIALVLASLAIVGAILYAG